ncbi:MAG TPA: type II toxin-antitoxin system VapC family toxin [Candidatus Methanoperedens sp.]
MNYFDSNIIIYAILDDTEKGEWAREVLEKVQKEEMPACTSFLTFDEVFYKVKKVLGNDEALKNIEAFLTMPNMRFNDVNDSVIWKALELITEYKLHPRDGIHAATALIAGADSIYSEDADFDMIKGLKRKWKD